MAVLICRYFVTNNNNSLFFPIIAFILFVILVAGFKDLLQTQSPQKANLENYYFYSQVVLFTAYIISLVLSWRMYHSDRVIFNALQTYLVSNLTIINALLLNYCLNKTLLSNLYFISCMSLFIYLPLWLALANVCQVFNDNENPQNGETFIGEVL